jgi:poly-gamma-glutamate synthesis protein (capsule biosynthesis protein)
MFILIALLCAQNPADARVTFCAVGDILLDRGIRRAINEHTIDYPFELVRSFIQGHDLAFCNLECPVSAKGRSTGKIYCFRADTSFFRGAEDAGFNIYSLANNHIIDWGQEACLDTRAFIEAQNLYAIGAGEDQEIAQKPLLLTNHGVRFAIFAYLGDPLRGVVWSEKRPGPAQAGIKEICDAISKVRHHVDFVIVSIHWGIEYIHTPGKAQISWAHAMIDAGADLIIGHHPHVLQSIEVYRNRVILYSLGNFVFDQRKTYQQQTGIFSCIFKPGRIDSASFTPCFIEDYRPGIVHDTLYASIRDKLIKISQDFKTEFIDDSTAVLIADTNRSLVCKTAIGRVSMPEYRVMIYPQRVELWDTLSVLKDIILIPDKDTIWDYCYIADTLAYHLCMLVSSPARHYVMHCSVSDSGFAHTWCSEEIINSWKLHAVDLDGDGRDELCVAVYTKEPHQTEATNKLNVYSIEHDRFISLYQGSRKSTHFIDCAFLDRDADGLAELYTLEPGTDSAYTLNVYQWLGTGFWKYPEVLDTVTTTWIEDVLQDVRR